MGRQRLCCCLSQTASPCLPRPIAGNGPLLAAWAPGATVGGRLASGPEYAGPGGRRSKLAVPASPVFLARSVRSYTCHGPASKTPLAQSKGSARLPPPSGILTGIQDAHRRAICRSRLQPPERRGKSPGHVMETSRFQARLGLSRRETRLAPGSQNRRPEALGAARSCLPGGCQGRLVPIAAGAGRSLGCWRVTDVSVCTRDGAASGAL